jgi:hypothetical protein
MDPGDLCSIALAEVRLRIETGKCGESVVHVEGQDGGMTAPVYRGGSGRFRVKSNVVVWFCGTTRESVTCPLGTNLVEIRREPEGRALFLDCLQDR